MNALKASKFGHYSFQAISLNFPQAHARLHKKRITQLHNGRRQMASRKGIRLSKALARIDALTLRRIADGKYPASFPPSAGWPRRTTA
jgi:hypothetical protein